ncbi:MAG: hypothetical protein JW940_23440 [Polyangiaceae bacterium]|nr:hypothetical protein [Polyangiaceae bacterium]
MTVLRPGTSIAGVNAAPGTLGLIVFRGQTPCVLSAWHVLVGPNGLDDSTVLAPPSQFGGQLPDDRVGRVSRHVRDARGEAAIVPIDGRAFDRALVPAGVTLVGSRLPEVGDVLHKCGATTQLTKARVAEVRTFTTQHVPGGVRGMRLVPHEDGPAEISRLGDSGAVWYDPVALLAVGLHLEGETSNDPEDEQAIACIAENVLLALEVSIVPAVP